jgi:transcriptional regulator with XRE-family HTH domain
MIKDRIAKIIKMEKVSSSKFADEIGVQRSNISHILSGRNNPSLDFIQKILTQFSNINPEWLLLGKGEMYKKEIPTLFNDSESIEKEETPIPVKKIEPVTVKIEKEPVKEEPEIKYKTQLSEPPIQQEIKTNPPLESVIGQSLTQKKKAEKIILFYNDHTFVEYKVND